ncbi:hypothetical protein Pla52n_69900 [Stieleria varia]|uniref:Uncharacterized protein n=1 Tax=Stieleria varia TaxID=2528005 RepID=A0A5C5ZKZ7_9BACT|nr:hypothetical protein Pla52n_69900 [Stieleria varia]
MNGLWVVCAAVNGNRSEIWYLLAPIQWFTVPKVCACPKAALRDASLASFVERPGVGAPKNACCSPWSAHARYTSRQSGNR